MLTQEIKMEMERQIRYGPAVVRKGRMGAEKEKQNGPFDIMFYVYFIFAKRRRTGDTEPNQNDRKLNNNFWLCIHSSVLDPVPPVGLFANNAAAESIYLKSQVTSRYDSQKM